ncbi:MAG: DUF998 domain-containing protein [Lactovum sp.]
MSKIILPQELYEKLELSKEEDSKVEIIDNAKNSFVIKSVSKIRKKSDIKWFLVPTVISSLLFLIISLFFLKKETLPFVGNDQSLATFILIVTNLLSFSNFIFAYIKKRENLYHEMSSNVYWRTLLTVIISELMISTLLLMAIFWFLNQIFYGVRFDILTSMIIVTLFSLILNYSLIFIIDNFKIEILVNMLILVALGGAISSIVTNGNPYWWKRNLSLLGTYESEARFEFNLTLLISGALLIALIDYIFVSMVEKFGKHWRYLILKGFLILAALSIMGIGLVPNNEEGHVLHTQLALFIFYFMALAILGIKWLLPELGKEFIRFSYLISFLLLICYILWDYLNYFNLTAFEIFSFALGFSWLLLFINRLAEILWNGKKVYKVEQYSSNKQEN